MSVCLAVYVPSTHANIYATNIKLNGDTNDIVSAAGNNVNISYILNEPASGGVVVQILSSGSVVREISVGQNEAGTARGTNTVIWDARNNAGSLVSTGLYAVAVKAVSLGYSNWTQITTDNTDGTYVYEGRGIAVDRNPGSPYYGRVFVANAHANDGGGSRPGDAVGILKLNADGSLADEGGFSTGGYNWSGDYFSPYHLEVSDDDFVYINDWTASGVVLRWDPTLSPESFLQVLGPTNYGNNGNVSLGGPAIYGSGTNTQIWMADITPGGLGVIRYNVTTNGTVAGGDVGITVVGSSDLLNLGPYDLALDKVGNIYILQNTTTPGDPSQRVLRFNAFDPSTNGGLPELTASWAVGGTNDSYGDARGIAVDPTGTYVAAAFGGVLDLGNTKILYATNGAEVLSLDLGVDIGGYKIHVDTDCAWDAVGNVYYIDNYYGSWRAVSPPGPNQSTTMALNAIQIQGSGGGGGGGEPISILGVQIVGTTVTLSFMTSPNDQPSDFAVLAALQPNGPYSQVTDATITAVSGTPGLFRASFTSTTGAVHFYRVQRIFSSPTSPFRITGLVSTAGTVKVSFTAGATDSPSAFTLLNATQPQGPYAATPGQSISGGAGAFTATAPASGAVQFYRIRK